MLQQFRWDAGRTAMVEVLATGRRLLRWWLDELIALVPARWRLALQPAGRRLILTLSPNGAAVIVAEDADAAAPALRLPTEPKPGGDDPLPADYAMLRARTRSIVLRLAAAMSLHKRVRLPRAAAANLHEAIAYDLDRQTPFTSDDVYFATRALDIGPDAVTAELIVVPRACLDPILERLAACNLTPDRVEPAAGWDGVDLLPPGPRSGRAGRHRRSNRLLAVAAAILTVVALAMPLLRLDAAVQAMAAERDAARELAAPVLTLEAQLAERRQQNHFLATQLQQRPPVVTVLDELSRLLPDDTWLNRLDLRRDGVRLHGQSQAAAALIARVEASPLFRDTAFSAPVTRLPDGQEQFRISTHLRQAEALP